jgi:hypothetical protein
VYNSNKYLNANKKLAWQLEIKILQVKEMFRFHLLDLKQKG